MRLLNALLRKLKLAVLWVVRILCAPNHFDIPVLKKVKYAVLGGFMADQVVLYDLDKGREQRKKYLSEFDWYRSRDINEPYSQMLNNKVVFSEMIRPFCPTPELYAVKKSGLLRGMRRGRYGTAQELTALLRETGGLVLKPVSRGRGVGVHIFRFKNGEFSDNGRQTNEAEIKARLDEADNYLVCAFARQADYLADIFPDSANTLRMIVLRSARTKAFELQFAVQRIGASWTGAVDNGSQGGLVSMVDIETGRLSEAKTLNDLNVYREHPDTHSPIEGVIIPDWNRIKKGVLLASEHFPYLDFIAWDILPTPEGFTVIEGNTSSGVNIIQIWGGQREGVLGDFYRAHKVIK